MPVLGGFQPHLLGHFPDFAGELLQLFIGLRDFHCVYSLPLRAVVLVSPSVYCGLLFSLYFFFATLVNPRTKQLGGCFSGANPSKFGKFGGVGGMFVKNVGNSPTRIFPARPRAIFFSLPVSCIITSTMPPKTHEHTLNVAIATHCTASGAAGLFPPSKLAS